MASNKGRPADAEFTGELYLAASTERASALQRLYASEDYALAIYIAGVAVESLLRAYRAKINREFSSRHDLYELAKEASFVEKMPSRLAAQCVANIGVVAVRWSNNHRYRTRRAVLRYLKRAGLIRGIKGDPLKENARRTINSALDLVVLGVNQWKKKS